VSIKDGEASLYVNASNIKGYAEQRAWSVSIEENGNR
jgi:fructose-specific phosphotransferase system component IIB